MAYIEGRRHRLRSGLSSRSSRSPPQAMVRYTLVDQVSRPSQGVDAIERLRVLEGFHGATRIAGNATPSSFPDPLVFAAAT